MVISVINHSNGQVSDDELQRVIRAINRQIREDFEPYWSLGATLRLEGRSMDRPDAANNADTRGDAVLYLWDETDVDGALGYHAANNSGIPFGFVFTSLSQELGEPWSVTLSHEAMELIGDPETNLLVMGPHPTEDRDVFHWFEMCDAVQDESYKLDGVTVSNFLLHLYFTGTREIDEVGARNDFLGTVGTDGTTIRSFGINRGGYIGFYDPQVGGHVTYSLRADARARKRMEIKQQAKQARRAVRYRCFEDREKLRELGVIGADGKGAGTGIGLSGKAVKSLAKAAAKKREYAPIGKPSGPIEVKAARRTAGRGSGELLPAGTR